MVVHVKKCTGEYPHKSKAFHLSFPFPPHTVGISTVLLLCDDCTIEVFPSPAFISSNARPFSPGLMPALKGVTNFAGVLLIALVLACAFRGLAPCKGLIGVTNPAGPMAGQDDVGRTGVLVAFTARDEAASGCGVLAGANPDICGRFGFSGELVYPVDVMLGVTDGLLRRGDLNGFVFCFMGSTSTLVPALTSVLLGNAEAGPNKPARGGRGRGKTEAGANRFAVGGKADVGMGANHAE